MTMDFPMETAAAVAAPPAEARVDVDEPGGMGAGGSLLSGNTA
jgi:hypothetical protein